MIESKSLSNETRPVDFISFAQLFKALPMEQVKASLCATDTNDQRERDLPARFIVYFVIALSIYSDCSSSEVFRQLVETLKNIFGPAVQFKVPAKSSLTYARTKLGVAPFLDLFRKLVKPIAIPGETTGAFFKGLRLVAIDGVQFNIPDTQENDQRFGRAKTSSSPAAFPAIRCVGLMEVGTRVMFDFEHGVSGGSKEDSENKLARLLLPRLKPGQICLADRLYGNYPIWEIASATGASLLWRVKADIRLECEKPLKDGSYMARLYDGDRRKSKKYVEVRVIEYSVGKETYRLMTNIPLDVANSQELAELYHERWEQENTNKELKCNLNSYLPTLRSKTPELAEQELIGLYLMHFIARSLMHEAALSVGEDVDRLSFKHTLNVIRRRAPQVGAFSP